MWFRDTPGPGGFGPSPAFGHAHPGIVLQPARTTARPGVYSGGNAVAAGHVWWWLALIVAVALVVVVVVAVTPVRHPKRNRGGDAGRVS